MSRFGPINLVIIQATSFCNLDCDYCYLPDRQIRNQLSLDLVEPIFRSIFTSPFVRDGFAVAWHAGEPLAMPISWYRSAFERIDEASRKYNHSEAGVVQSLQTNATMITQAWCDFFKESGVEIGVSLDGPAFIHDAHRVTRKGTGSHEAAMRGVKLLQENDIPFHVIAVVSKDSLDHADEIYRFFVENGIEDVGFNIEETEGVNTVSSLEDKGDIDQRFAAFMKRIWELTAAGGGVFKLREFEALCNMIYYDTRATQTDMNAPFVIVNFDYKGNFSTFDPEMLGVKTGEYGDFIFGNVLTDSLESICHTEKFQRVQADMQAGVALCRDTCSYFGVCGGGAGSNKYFENGSFNSAETQACRYRTKIVTDIVLEAFERPAMPQAPGPVSAPA
jgi:uncharacterized protein